MKKWVKKYLREVSLLLIAGVIQILAAIIIKLIIGLAGNKSGGFVASALMYSYFTSKGFICQMKKSRSFFYSLYRTRIAIPVLHSCAKTFSPSFLHRSPLVLWFPRRLKI